MTRPHTSGTVWRGLALALAAALLLAIQPAAGRAQQVAQLVADSLRIEADSRLIAEGNVEVFYQGARLVARRLVYDRATDRLIIDGPIRLSEGDGFVLVADAADLAADLRDGVLSGARLVLERQMQMAAAEIARVGGRHTRLSQVVASSCQVCANRPTPLWEVRAARVTHDQQTRQIHFEQAEFRMLGQTLAYLPRLRMPDPTVRRATGFLTPEISASGTLGAGLALPYFIALTPDRDLTLTPRLTSKGALGLGWRYRQAFASGSIAFEGSLTRDRLKPGSTRGHLTGSGDFVLAPGLTLTFGIEAVSDPRYLDQHGISGQEQIGSDVTLLWLDRDALTRARLAHFHILRPGVDNRTQPSLAGDLRHEQRFALPGLGGTARLSLDLLTAYRRSDDPLGGAGRDMTRTSLGLDWRRDWVLPGGVLAAALGTLHFDHFRIRQDAGAPPRATRTGGAAAVELRWPLVRTGAGGATDVIEPVVQLVWAPDAGAALPDEDSLLVEFDEGNLFALHRFAGQDQREAGSRANVGIAWQRHDPAGWSLGVTAGRVWRDSDQSQFSDLSGLGGIRSDWLAAVQLATAGGLALANRALIDSEGALTKNELRLSLSGERLDLGATLVHLIADPAEDRPDPSTDWAMDAAWRIDGNWTALADLNYDLRQRTPDRIGLGAQFRNECLAVDVSLSRRFASSTSVTARTDFGLRVDLIGFGSSPAGPARGCGR